MRKLLLIGGRNSQTKSVYVDLSMCVIEIINSDSPEATQGQGYIIHTPAGFNFSAVSKEDIQSVQIYINENLIIPIWPKNNPGK